MRRTALPSPPKATMDDDTLDLNDVVEDEDTEDDDDDMPIEDDLSDGEES